MATCSSILAWRISSTEEPGGLQSMRQQKVGQDWAHTHSMELWHCGTKQWARNKATCLVLWETKNKKIKQARHWCLHSRMCGCNRRQTCHRLPRCVLFLIYLLARLSSRLLTILQGMREHRKFCGNRKSGHTTFEDNIPTLVLDSEGWLKILKEKTLRTDLRNRKLAGPRMSGLLASCNSEGKTDLTPLYSAWHYCEMSPKFRQEVSSH